MYLVIAEYGHEIVLKEISTKKLVKQYIKENKRNATGFDIYKVTKKLPVDEFETK